MPAKPLMQGGTPIEGVNRDSENEFIFIPSKSNCIRCLAALLTRQNRIAQHRARYLKAARSHPTAALARTSSKAIAKSMQRSPFPDWTPCKPFHAGNHIQAELPRSRCAIWLDRIATLHWNVPQTECVTMACVAQSLDKQSVEITYQRL